VTQWPKVIPDLDPADQATIDDAIQQFHENPPRSWSVIERFNHRYPLRSYPRRGNRFRTIEIGAGVGSQLEHEDLSRQEYTAVEMRPDMAGRIKERFPAVDTPIADCQARLPFADAHFDRAVAVHVLEHLRDLPRALDELARLLRPGGRLSVVVPCDPGFVYGVGRRFTAQRAFERAYGKPYELFVRREHINSPAEIVGLLRERFRIVHRRFFPFRVPSVNLNVCLGVTAERGGADTAH
jgi:SAM-dependent methyltransferase